MLRVPAPAGAFAVQADDAPERRVLGREHLPVVRVQNLPKGAGRDEAGTKARGGVLARGGVDDKEEMEAAVPAATSQVVNALRCARVTSLPLGADWLPA